MVVDTRSKICPAAAALAQIEAWRRAAEPVAVAAGPFDPMIAAFAQQLAGLKRDARLAVFLTEPPAPVLPAQARAELVAALAAVDLVVLPGCLIPPEATDLSALQLAGRAKFEEHVHARQSA